MTPAARRSLEIWLQNGKKVVYVHPERGTTHVGMIADRKKKEPAYIYVRFHPPISDTVPVPTKVPVAACRPFVEGA